MTACPDRGADANETVGVVLVVLTCLGVLAPNAGARFKPTQTACKLDRIALKTAEEAYFALNNAYANMDQLIAARMLRHASRYHTVTVNGEDYTVTPKRRTGC